MKRAHQRRKGQQRRARHWRAVRRTYGLRLQGVDWETIRLMETARSHRETVVEYIDRRRRTNFFILDGQYSELGLTTRLGL